MRTSTLVGAGLFVVWAAHDAEELVTMQATSREVTARAPTWLPIPDDIRRDGYSSAHLRTGIGIMAVLMGVATLDGVRSDGRSPFFRTILQGFGWHGVGHIGASLLLRRYTSGVATSPVIVIPYWLWARRALARDGAPVTTNGLRSALLIPPVILGAHAAARVLTQRSRLGGRQITAGSATAGADPGDRGCRGAGHRSW